MNNLFTAGSVGSVQVMVAMLLLHVVVALQANLVDAWCSQATLHGHERLYPARRYPCASAVLVRPALDAVPRAVSRLNMVSTKVTYSS